MPLKLIEPRKGKTPFYAVRGTYLGQRIDRSTKTSKRALALKLLKKWEGEIERGEFAQLGEPTFASAAIAYMNADGEARFMTPLLNHFGSKPLRLIDQAEIDAAALAILPNATAATRNRQVYTPISAVLRHAGHRMEMRRPRGHAAKKAPGWLWPEQAHALLAAAGELNAEFGLFCRTLLYAGGLRLSEGLGLEVDNMRLSEATAFLPETKNSLPRQLYLPSHLVAALANHPRGMKRPGERVFRFHKSGALYTLLRKAAEKAGVTLPRRRAFHIFCHTYGTWMRRYAGVVDLTDTNRWTDPKSASLYNHVVVTEEQRRAEMLPVPAVENLRKTAS